MFLYYKIISFSFLEKCTDFSVNLHLSISIGLMVKPMHSPEFSLNFGLKGELETFKIQRDFMLICLFTKDWVFLHILTNGM